MEKDSITLAVVYSVFMYRVNVALAGILLFINVQIFGNIMFFADSEIVTQNAPFISGGLMLLSLIYGFYAFNGMLTKITVFEDALEYKSILRRVRIEAADIASVSFYRRDKTRLKITIERKEDKPFIINAAKFKDSQPVVDFCSRFKKV
ncbi:MAG: SIP1 domain-containing protein [Defluviitaleaceae bacterium]|nr:SIP1 domain-containing protein [Defluviitaleaceae bacterium]